MAYTEFGTSDPQTRKVWSQVTFLQAILKTRFATMMGRGEDAIIQRFDELQRGAGDEIKFDLLLQFQGYGVDGDERLKGKGEALRYVQDALKINQKRIAHEFKGMSQQRTVHDLRMDARRNLRDRWAVILDEFMFAYACGLAYGDLANALPFAGNALRSPDAAHTVDATAVNFSLELVDIAKERARTADVPIRPAMVEGRQMYVMYITPFQETALKRSQEWRELHRDGSPRGSRNPLFTGSLGVYNDVILHSSDYLPTLFVSAGSASNRSHALLMGAQAMAVAFGNAIPATQRRALGGGMFLNWAEELDDYGNEQGVAAGVVFGMSKPQFSVNGTTQDFATIRVDTKDGQTQVTTP